MRLHALCFVFLCVSPFVVFTKTLVSKGLVAAVVALTLAPVLVVHRATLSWDMLRLLTTTFEFWFFLFINIVDNVVWVSLFRGVRVLAMLVICAGCMLGMFLDANIHTRALVLRLFLVGAPSLLFALAAVDFWLAADLAYISVNWWGVTIDPVDIVAGGTWIVAFFMVKKAFRNRRFIFSRTRTRPNCNADDTTLCEMLHQRVVLFDEAVRRRQGLVGYDALGLGPLATALAKTQLSALRQWLAPARHVGRMSVIGKGSFGKTNWQTLRPSSDMQPIIPTTFSRRTSTLLSLVMLWCGVKRQTKNVLPASVTYWMVGLDALTPVVRERLRLSRLFILLVNGTLMLCPLRLAYMLYFSEQEAKLRKREVFHVTIAHIEVRAEMLSFLASRIFTLWVWTSRFFWRELMRSADAFKLIKPRVQFRAGTSS